MNRLAFHVKPALIAVLFLLSPIGLLPAPSVVGQSPLALDNPRSAFPKSTYFIFRSTHVEASTTAIVESEFGKRLYDEPWKSLAETHRSQNIPSLLNTSPWMGIEWRELQTVESEGYFIGFLDAEQKPHVAFLIRLGESAPTHPFVVAWKKTFGDRTPLQSVKVNDSVTMWISSPSSASATSTGAALAIGPQWTLISTSPKAIQEWLSNPGSSNLPSSSVQEKIFTSTSSPSDVQFWLSPWPLLRSYTEVEEPRLFKSFSKFGLDQITACYGQIQFTEKPTVTWQVKADVEWQKPLTKAMAALSFVNGPDTPRPHLALGETDSTRFDNFSMAHFDNKPWFQGLSYLADLSIDEETPGGFADILDSLLTDPEGPKIDVRQEVIYKLGNPMIIGGASVPDTKQANQVRRELLTAFPFPDTSAMRELLSRMFAGDEEVTSESIGDYQIWYTVHNESLFVSMSEGESQTITAAAVDKTHFYLATNTQWLKKLIQAAEATSPQKHNATNKDQAIAFRQYFDLTSWLQRSWQRIPEPSPSRQNYESMDLPALILTNTLVPQTSVENLPLWQDAKDLFGTLSIVGQKTESGVTLSITWQ